MPTRILCPKCSAELRLSEAFLGKTVKCPQCASTFTARAEQRETPFENRIPRPSRRRGEVSQDDEPEIDRPTPKTGLWIGLWSALCLGLLMIFGFLLLSENREDPALVVQAPPIPKMVPQPRMVPAPVMMLPQQILPEGAPNNGDDFANRFGDGLPEKAVVHREQVKLSNPRYQKDAFSFEKLCVDYEFSDGSGIAPRIGLVMMLKSGNRLSEATLFGLIDETGTIALDNFGFEKIPSGTEVWLVEKMGFGRFGPEPKRISNVVVIP